MTDRTKRAFMNFIFPLLLFLYPFFENRSGNRSDGFQLRAGQLSVFPQCGREWTVATWLANVLGAILIRLPFGETLIGIRFYCSFLSASWRCCLTFS